VLAGAEGASGAAIGTYPEGVAQLIRSLLGADDAQRDQLQDSHWHNEHVRDGISSRQRERAPELASTCHAPRDGVPPAALHKREWQLRDRDDGERRARE
jgi:hypothetical protein